MVINNILPLILFKIIITFKNKRCYAIIILNFDFINNEIAFLKILQKQFIKIYDIILKKYNFAMYHLLKNNYEKLENTILASNSIQSI